MFVPIKTNDIVSQGEKKYVVKSVQLTSNSAIVEVAPISDKSEILHISEINLVDSDESTRRIKSAGLDTQRYYEENSKAEKQIVLPQGMTIEEANRILIAEQERKAKAYGK